MIGRARRAVGAAVLVSLVVAGCGAGEQPAAESSSGLGCDLDPIVGAFVEQAPGGAVVLVGQGDEVRTAVAGQADAEGTSVNADTPFRVGSISKVFVATMIMQLVEEGAVDLDASVATYLPQTPVGAGVTVRSLLNHTSGLADFSQTEQFNADIRADPTRVFSPADDLSYIEDPPAGQTPGFAYSNTNYILAGQIVVALDGTDLETALQTRIAEPLGLATTHFAGPGVTLPDGLAAGRFPGLFDGDPDQPYTALESAAWAAGSLVSTADELREFLLAMVAGRVVSGESLAEMVPSGSDGYGLGVVEYQFDGAGGGESFGHSGVFPGYHATMAVDPGTQNVLVVLTNNDELISDDLAADVRCAFGG